MKTYEDQELEELFAPLKKVSASENLQARVDRLAYETRPAQAPRIRTLAFLALGIASGILLLNSFGPPAFAGAFVDRMARAVEGARTVHLRSFTLVKNEWRLDLEEWYAKGNWRIERAGATYIYGGNHKWSYDAIRHVALVGDRRLGENPPGVEGAFKLTNIYGWMNAHGFHFHLAYGTSRTEQGRNVSTVTVTRDSHDRERDVFTVDSNTDLPLTGQSEVLTPSGWSPRVKWTAEYDVPVAADMFSGRFPADTAVIDDAELHDDWARRLSKVVAESQLAGQNVRVRDVFVNSRGWVFLLWTGPIAGDGYRLFLTDDQGRQYTRAPFNPAQTPHEPGSTTLFVRDNGANGLVDGAWFVPLDPAIVGPVRSLSLHVFKVNQPEQLEDAPPAAATRQDAGAIKINELRTERGELPEYMPLLESGISSVEIGELRALLARKYYWALRLNATESGPASQPPHGDGAPNCDSAHFNVPQWSVSANSDRTVLAELEKIELSLIPADERTRPDGEASAFEWYDLSVVERALGKTSEADRALAEARRIRPEIRWP